MLQPLKNHYAILLDASGSMKRHESAVIKVTDALVRDLANQSVKMGQETRISLYRFADYDQVECLVFDVDVMRLPSIADLYKLGTMTALIKATRLALEDFDLLTQKYGDHGFFLWLVTDGLENDSPYDDREWLQAYMKARPDNLSIAALVPDNNARTAMEKIGFPTGNIETWDIKSATGIADVAKKISTATTAYMTTRATRTAGSRSSTSIFTVAPIAAQDVVASGIRPLEHNKYIKLRITASTPGLKTNKLGLRIIAMSDFIRSEGHTYRGGSHFYQLREGRRTTIQGNKTIAVMHKGTSLVYYGADARALLKLPAYDVKVTAAKDDEYTIFVQSTANNRNVYVGDEVFTLL